MILEMISQLRAAFSGLKTAKKAHGPQINLAANQASFSLADSGLSSPYTQVSNNRFFEGAASTKQLITPLAELTLSCAKAGLTNQKLTGFIEQENLIANELKLSKEALEKVANSVGIKSQPEDLPENIPTPSEKPAIYFKPSTTPMPG